MPPARLPRRAPAAAPDDSVIDITHLVERLTVSNANPPSPKPKLRCTLRAFRGRG